MCSYFWKECGIWISQLGSPNQSLFFLQLSTWLSSFCLKCSQIDQTKHMCVTDNETERVLMRAKIAYSEIVKGNNNDSVLDVRFHGVEG